MVERELTIGLRERLLRLDAAFRNEAIPHAFGGAIALGYWGEPRATYDLDINVYLIPEHGLQVLQALATVMPISDLDDLDRRIRSQAQVRIYWDQVAVDLFFQDIDLHESMAKRTVLVIFSGRQIPIISAEDLIICKIAYNRP